jgi:hypothetical protein
VQTSRLPESSLPRKEYGKLSNFAKSLNLKIWHSGSQSWVPVQLQQPNSFLRCVSVWVLKEQKYRWSTWVMNADWIVFVISSDELIPSCKLMVTEKPPLPVTNFSPVQAWLRTPLCFSGQGSWLLIQKSGFGFRHYKIYLRSSASGTGPLSLVGTIEKLLKRKSSDSGLENGDSGIRGTAALATRQPSIRKSYR